MERRLRYRKKVNPTNFDSNKIQIEVTKPQQTIYLPLDMVRVILDNLVQIGSMQDCCNVLILSTYFNEHHYNFVVYTRMLLHVSYITDRSKMIISKFNLMYYIKYISDLDVLREEIVKNREHWINKYHSPRYSTYNNIGNVSNRLSPSRYKYLYDKLTNFTISEDEYNELISSCNRVFYANFRKFVQLHASDYSINSSVVDDIIKDCVLPIQITNLKFIDPFKVIHCVDPYINVLYHCDDMELILNKSMLPEIEDEQEGTYTFDLPEKIWYIYMSAFTQWYYNTLAICNNDHNNAKSNAHRLKPNRCKKTHERGIYQYSDVNESNFCVFAHSNWKGCVDCEKKITLLADRILQMNYALYGYYKNYKFMHHNKEQGDRAYFAINNKTIYMLGTKIVSATVSSTKIVSHVTV